MRSTVAVLASTAMGVPLVLLAPTSVGAAIGPSSDDTVGKPSQSATVLVLVPDLRWDTAPPALDGYARANMSVRAASPRAGPADGYLTIGNGARTGAPDDIGVGRVVDDPAGGLRLADWDRLLRHDDDLDGGGRLGALGDALNRSGRPWAFVYGERSGAAAAADPVGRVPVALLGEGPGVAQALTTGAEAVIVAVHLPGLAGVLDASAGAGARCIIVASVSTPDENRHLGVLATSGGCELGRGGLTSTSTHQPHLTTLTDVSPTFLSILDIPRPETMAGAAVRPAPPASRDGLERRAERAFTGDRARTPLIWMFVGLHALGAVLALVWARARRPVAYGLLAIPPASYLMMAVPWWRAGFVGAVLTAGSIAAVLAVAAAVVDRGDRLLGVAILAAVTTAVIGIDALFRAPLQIDAPFGNSPISAGRFFGVGNIGFSFLAASALVVAALVLHRQGRPALPWVAAALAAVVVADGAPWFGADAGGVLAAVPAFGALLLAWQGQLPNLRRLALLAVAAVAVVLLFAALDATRPAGEQTHLGRALGSDDLGDLAARKGERALATLRTPIANVVWIGLATLLVLRRRVSYGSWTVALATALVILGGAGSVLNDSGLQVAAGVSALGWPAFLAISTPAVSTAGPPPSRHLVGHESRN